MALNGPLDKINLIDIFRTFYPKTAEFTFSSAHGIFSRTELILGLERSLNKFKKV